MQYSMSKGQKMPNIKYPTKTVLVHVRGEAVDRVVAADLDRVYVGGDGNTLVYYDAKKKVNGMHLFKQGPADEVVARMKTWS